MAGVSRGGCGNDRNRSLPRRSLVQIPALAPGKSLAIRPAACGSFSRGLRSLDGGLHGGGTAEGGRRSRRCQSRAHDQSRGLHRALHPGLQGRGRPAQTLHDGGRHERNGEIEEDGEKARKGHDEREHQPVVHDDQVRAVWTRLFAVIGMNSVSLIA